PLTYAASSTQIDLYGVGTDGHVNNVDWNTSSNAWNGYAPDGTMSFAAGTQLAVVLDGGGVHVYGIGSDGYLKVVEWTAALGHWSGSSLNGAVQFDGTAPFDAGAPLIQAGGNGMVDLYGVAKNG